jgi:hypothetical protein
VASVHRVGQCALEVAKVGTESVAVQEQDVVRVDRSDGLFDSDVKVDQTGVLLVCWLIQGVVTGDPGVVLVVLGEVFPDLDGSVLEVLVYPDCERVSGAYESTVVSLTVGLVVSGVGVPVNVLALRYGQDKQSGGFGSNSLLGRRANR